MQDTIRLSPHQLRVVAHPLRAKLLRLLARDTSTVADLRTALGAAAPSNLYYHLDRLHQAGLVEVVREEPRRGTTLRFYRATAKRVTTDPDVLGSLPADRSLDDGIVSPVRDAAFTMLEDLASSLARGLLGSGRASVVPSLNWCSIRTTPAKAEELRKGLAEWVEALEAAQTEDGSAVYSFFQAFFPTELPDRRA